MGKVKKAMEKRDKLKQHRANRKARAREIEEANQARKKKGGNKQKGSEPAAGERGGMDAGLIPVQPPQPSMASV